LETRGENQINQELLVNEDNVPELIEELNPIIVYDLDNIKLDQDLIILDQNLPPVHNEILPVQPQVQHEIEPLEDQLPVVELLPPVTEIVEAPKRRFRPHYTDEETSISRGPSPLESFYAKQALKDAEMQELVEATKNKITGTSHPNIGIPLNERDAIRIQHVITNQRLANLESAMQPQVPVQRPLQYPMPILDEVPVTEPTINVEISQQQTVAKIANLAFNVLKHVAK
jgi:hypothetical protein